MPSKSTGAVPESRIDAVLHRVFGTSGAVDSASYLKTFYQQLVLGSQIAARHPSSDSDVAFHAYDTRQERVEAQARRLEDVLVALTGQAARLSVGYGEATGAVTRAELREARDDPDAPSTKLTDIADNLFEGADFDLDEAKGAGNNAQAAVVKGDLGAQRGRREERQLARHIRPQDSFEVKADNSRAPFVPVIKTKYHAMVPLPSYSPQPEGSAYGAYVHPYQEEVTNLTYLDAQLRRRDPTKPGTLKDVPLQWVDTPAALEKMIATLESSDVTEIAIDLEHHNLHSFLGFTCLIQVSSRDCDYIIDPLVPAVRSRVCDLNRITTDPAIVKVLHGCDKDVMWLQRDFGVYLVNVFDSGQAARVLQLPSFGLLHLLQRFCGVTPDKSLQRSDWRLRPLSHAMRKYAREDTHYLLYIYDRLVNELLDASTNAEGNLLHEVLRRSAGLCLQKYEKPVLAPESHLRLMELVGIHTASAKSQRVFAALYEWRDRVARDIDESPNAVLHHRPMGTLARRMPVNTEALVEALNPLPPHVRTRAHEVVEVIVAARASVGGEASPDGPSAPTVVTPSPQNFVPLMQGAPDHKLGAVMSPTPSPVPTTDQLCQDAGWLKPSDINGPRRTALASEGLRRTMFEEAERSTVLSSSPSEDARNIAIRNRIAETLRRTLQASRSYSSNNNNQDEDGDQDDAGDAGAGGPSPPRLPAPRSTGPGGAASPRYSASPTEAAGIVIPRSLSEIYQISNRNRKRNKEKKRAKDADPSGAGGAKKKKSRNAAGSGGGNTAANAGASETPDQFMQRIGWTAGDDGGSDATASAGATSTGGKPGGFRYGSSVTAAAGMGSGRGGNNAHNPSGSGGGKAKGGRGRRGGRGGGRSTNNPYVSWSGDGASGGGRRGGGGRGGSGRGGRRGGGGSAYKQRMRHAGERSSASTRRHT